MTDIFLANPRAGQDGPWNRLREPRLGVMLHWDGSFSDRGALLWLLSDPRCRVSYNWLVLDDGTVRDIAPPRARAWHAGDCRTSDPARLPYRDANSAFYSIAAAAKPGDTITPKQFRAIADLTRACFDAERWPLTDTWRVTDHSREAWPRGRKHDIGLVHGLSLARIRTALQTL